MDSAGVVKRNNMKLDNLIKVISIGLAILIAFVSVIAWLTTIQINGRNNTVSIELLGEKIDAVASDVSKVKTDVALIRQALGVGRVSISDLNALK